MTKLSPQTIALLEDIERRIDPEVETDFENQWHDFLYNRFDGDILFPTAKKPLLTARPLRLSTSTTPLPTTI
ncbi:MAG: hypothetical protein IJX06_01660 [Clostridia bacterium]|nr:hypothetical protein [Clostridia bacterium]